MFSHQLFEAISPELEILKFVVARSGGTQQAYFARFGDFKSDPNDILIFGFEENRGVFYRFSAPQFHHACARRPREYEVADGVCP